MTNYRRFFDQYATNFTSKWLVLGIDLVLVLVSYFFALVIRFNFIFDLTTWLFYLPKIYFVLAAHVFGFIVFKPYVGVIRHTSINDGKRIFYSAIAGAVLLTIFNIVIYSNGGGVDSNEYLFVPLSIIAINFLVTNFVLLFSRIIFKLTYYRLAGIGSGQARRVAIFGAGQAGLITLNTLRADQSMSNKIVGFFDDNNSKIGISISGVKVHSFDKYLDALIEKHGLDYVVIAVNKLPASRKREVVDALIERNIEVKTIPPVRDWVNGELSSKQIKDVRMSDLLGRDQISLDNENVSREIKGKVVMVTGAAGSIGSEIVKQAYTYGPSKLLLVDQAETPTYELQYDLKRKFGEKALESCESIICDVVDRGTLKSIFEEFGVDVVYHAAAYKHVPLMEDNPSEGIKTNVVGTRNCADLALEFGVEKFVMVSTDKAVNPTNVMGATKRVAEKYVCSLNGKGETKFVTTRFGNVLGSNGSVIPLFRKQIENGGPVLVTHPDITRFFMTIPEACQLVLEAGAMGEGGEVFVFDMGESVKIYDVAKKMIKFAGLELGKDIDIKFIGLRPGEKLYEELLTTKENCIDTHHPKIMRAKIEECKDVELLLSQINEVSELAKQRTNNKAAVRVLKKIVPEYKSNNSIYEELDK